MSEHQQPHEAYLRCARLLAVIVLAVGALITSASLSEAAPNDLTQVRAELRELRMQSAAADEAYNKARTDLDEAQAALRDARRDSRRAQGDVSRAKRTVEALARTLYMQGGWGSPIASMLLSDPESFLLDSARTAMISERQASDIRRLAAAQLRLRQTTAKAQAIRERASAAERRAAAARRASDEKLASAERLLASLESKQRRQLAREQARAARAQAAAAREQARKVASTSGGGGGGAPAGPAPGGGVGAVSARARAAIQYALAQVGKRYVRAGAGPSVFDCSGLTKAAYARAGIGLTHYSKAQWAQTKRIPPSQIRPGDLVFYFAPDASHVAIYVGNGKMVSASNPDDGVELIDYLGPWYRERFSGVGRVIT